jgi:hypothetical protein
MTSNNKSGWVRNIAVRLSRGLSVVLVVTALAVVQPAMALPLLTVTGSGTTGQIINGDQAVAVSFSLDQTYANVSISADVICVGCVGSVFLMQDLIGPTATLANFVDGLAFDVSSSVDPLLSDLTLSAGDYFVILGITTTSAGWVGSSTPTITTAPGITHGINYFASNLNTAVPYQSDFLPIFSTSALHFSVSGDAQISSVPEPSTMVLMALGLIALVMSQRRRRHAAAPAAHLS